MATYRYLYQFPTQTLQPYKVIPATKEFITDQDGKLLEVQSKDSKVELVGKPIPHPASRKTQSEVSEQETNIPLSVKNNLFYNAQILKKLEQAEKSSTASEQQSLWQDHIDIRKIKFQTLRENPEQAAEIFDMLHRTYRDFNPVKNFMQKIEKNPHIKVPDSFLKESFFQYFRPSMRLTENNTFETVYVPITDPHNMDLAITPSEMEDPTRLKEVFFAAYSSYDLIDKWLKKANFVDVYQTLFDLDLRDQITHEKAYQLKRYVTLITDLAEWALGMIPFGAASAALYMHPAGFTFGDPASDPFHFGLLILLGITAINSPSGMKDSPIASLVKVILLTASLLNKGDKFAGLFSSLSNFFSREETNYFLSKHLDTKGMIQKYLKAIIKHGSDGFWLELYKDFPDEYKAYKALKSSANFFKESLSKTGIEYLTKVGEFLPTLIKYFPSTQGQLVGSFFDNAWLLTWTLIVGVSATGGNYDSTYILSLLGSAALLLATSMIAKSQIEEIKKDNIAEALIYRELIDFSIIALSILCTNIEEFQNLFSYSFGIAGAMALIFGTGHLLTKRAEKSKVFRIETKPDHAEFNEKVIL